MLSSAGLPAGRGGPKLDSTNNAPLKKVLERYPEADTNANGILTPSEARAFRDKLQGKNKKPESAEQADDPSLNGSVVNGKMLAFFFKYLKVSN